MESVNYIRKLLLWYLKPYYERKGLGFVIKFIGTIMDLCLPWILAHMIDVIISRKDEKQIFFWGFIMLICSELALTFNVIANRMASKVARDTTDTYNVHQLYRAQFE